MVGTSVQHRLSVDGGLEGNVRSGEGFGRGMVRTKTKKKMGGKEEEESEGEEASLPVYNLIICGSYAAHSRSIEGCSWLL